MTRQIFKTLASLAFCAATFSAVLTPRVFAQSSRLVVVNGGRFEFAPPFRDFVSVGYIDTQAGAFVKADSILGQSVTDGITVNDTLYLATDIGVRAYSLPTFSIIGTSPFLSGIRKLAKVGNKLWATRGFGTPAGGSYLLALDPNRLTVTDSVGGFPSDLEHLVSGGQGTLFVGNPGSFLSDTGAIFRVDTRSLRITAVYRLGTLGKGIGKLGFANGRLTAIASRGFGAPRGAFVTIASALGMPAIQPLSFAVGGVVSYRQGLFIGQLDSLGLGVANGDFSGLRAQPRVPNASAAVEVDTLANRAWITTADFASNGQALAFNLFTGQPEATYRVGISPEVILHWRAAQLTSTLQAGLSLHPTLYPNPAQEAIYLAQFLAQGYDNFAVYDAQGREHLVQHIDSQKLNTSDLAPGVYTLVAKGPNGIIATRFMKN